MNTSVIDLLIAKHIFHWVTLGVDEKVFKKNPIFAAEAFSETGSCCVFTLLCCPTHEYKYLPVCIIIYKGKIFGLDADYAEIGSVKISVAPDAYQRHAGVLTYELSNRRDILDTVQFSEGLGYSQAGALLGLDNCYWSLGALWFLASYLTLDAHLDEHHNEELQPDEFYPQPLENNYRLSTTLGF